MIPLNTFTVLPVVTAFLPPLDEPYSPLFMRATGGIAIGDGSQGRQVQFWSCEYVDGVIVVSPAMSGIAGFSLAVADAISVCLAFDSNMAVTLCWTKLDGAYLYFFNSSLGHYDTLFIAGATSARICVDDPAAFYDAQSDVMFAYTLSGSLYWRQQRDRYTIQRTVGVSDQTLVRFGPSLGNRLQFQLLNL